MNSSRPPLRLAFMLAPQFSMMSFAAAIEPLRAANRLAGVSLFEWTLVSDDGAAVTASNGISVAVEGSIAQLRKPDVLVLCIALDPLQFQSNWRLRHQLRLFARRGCRIGGISGATFVLADAHLLDGRRCTVHWEYADLFHLRYPSIDLVEELYVIDDQVFTCSGGTAAMDLMLHFIREHATPELALSVAEQFIHPRIRDHSDHQRMQPIARYPLATPKLTEVIGIMESTMLDCPLNLSALAQRAGISLRHVERLFRRELDMSPRDFYLKLRLDRGRTLLTSTVLPVHDIALETGFSSASHFSCTYKRIFGLAPREERSRRRLAQRGSAGRLPSADA